MAIYASSYEEDDPSEAGIVDRYRLDQLYTHPFKNNVGKFFTVVSEDDDSTPNEVEAAHPTPTRSKVKTTLTFVKGDGGGSIRTIEIKRFRYYSKKGWTPQEEHIRFSFPYFVSLVSFLQGLAGLNLDKINERRVPLANSPTLDDETVRQFRTLASTGQGQELIAEALQSGQVTSADLVNVGYRKAQLERFERMMGSPEAIEEYRRDNNISQRGEEAVWQTFFEKNTWIFGYGLSFVINQPLEGRKLEQTVVGSTVAGSGKRADGLLKTTGIINSMCFVEIKTPRTSLMETEQYRPDCWRMAAELAGGIAQSQKTVQKSLENIGHELRPRSADGSPTGEIVYSYKPKAYLIIGNLGEFETSTGVNRERFASFELLRRSTQSPEIITFDELLERARFIVDVSSVKS
jgi:hypothetical protein